MRSSKFATHGAQDVVVAFDPVSESGGIFDRMLEGRLLSFELLSGGDGGFMLMRDLETGSTWQALTGRAIDGPLAGSALTHLPAHYSFWFAWSDFHPHPELYGEGG